MDNRKWYKRLSTFFWFLMATFPIWFCLFGAIFNLLALYGTDLGSNATSNLDLFNRSFKANFDNLLLDNDFYSLCPSFLTNMFLDLFETIGISSSTLDNLSFEFFPAWFVWVYMIELLVDFIVWLPRWFHSILEKGFDKL